MAVIRRYDDKDARREAIVEAMKRQIRKAGITTDYDADVEYMEYALVALVDEQLRGAVLSEDEVDGLHSAINAAVHHGVLTGERVDALRARVDSLGGQ